MQMMSNVISDEYKEDIVNRTLDQIHKGIKNVYGPYGTDVFIKKNQQTYYTRDGKEVIGTMRFNNALANDVLAIMYQAVEKQARTAGDGTTTLIMLYVNLYKQLGYALKGDLGRYSTSEIRRTYEQVTKEVIAELQKKTVELDDELFKSMLYTCTQDPDLAMTIFNNLRGDVEKDSYIIVTKSDFSDEMSVERSEYPILKCDKIYSYQQLQDTFTNSDTRLVYVDGVLDIANMETVASLLTCNGGGSTIGILCAGLTEATRQTLQKVKGNAQLAEIPPSQLNNLVIFRLDNYRVYDKIMKEDLTSIIYNEEELTGVTNNISFEAYLARTAISDIDEIVAAYEEMGMSIPDIFKFDAAQHGIDRLTYAISTPRGVEYSIGDGLKINTPMNEITTARYMALKEAIAEEKSAVKRADMIRRLRTVFGVFVEVKVGSQLLKDSQRKFELILDAVVSSQEGFNKGVLKNNSLIETVNVINALLAQTKPADQTLREDILNILLMAIGTTITDMLENRYKLYANELALIRCRLFDSNSPIGPIDIRRDIYSEDGMLNFDNLVRETSAVINEGDDMSIRTDVVEPFTIIETLLQNSTLAVDLALSRIFIVDDFMGNYI